MDIYAFYSTSQSGSSTKSLELKISLSGWLPKRNPLATAAMGQDAEVNQGESDRFIEQWIAYIMVSFRFSRKKQTTLTVIVQ